MVAFIDQHRDTYGVEPICAALISHKAACVPAFQPRP
jgi:hypothetical protein